MDPIIDNIRPWYERSFLLNIFLMVLEKVINIKNRIKNNIPHKIEIVNATALITIPTIVIIGLIKLIQFLMLLILSLIFILPTKKIIK